LSPLQICERLTAATGSTIYLKREDLQMVRSYKIRGAFNFMLQLDADERARGVVCASAGNHAQGFARACKELGIQGTIFVPKTTPKQKIERVRHFGGEQVTIEIAGSTYDDASALAHRFAERNDALLVSAFDDRRTIAGQGTVAAEIHAQLETDPDYIIVPVGGGGGIAGIAAYAAERMPHTKILAAEPAGAASTLATEMLDMYQVDGIIAEPSGALASAGIGGPESGKAITIEPGSTVVCLVSGGNNDISRYPEILERSLVHEGLKHYFIVDFPQEPGALRRFLNEVL